MKEIGIFGGTFNPMHIRELQVAQFAIEQFGLAKVIFVPNGTPPHKKTDVLDCESRYEMVLAAIKDNSLFEASRVEIDRPGVTWTIDTLKELKALLGDDVRLNFICGEDVIENLARYDRRKEFLDLVRLLVCPRTSDDSVKALASWKVTLPDADIELIDCPVSGMSSTLVRKWIRAGKSIKYVVHPSVLEIIERKGHYKEIAEITQEQEAERTVEKSVDKTTDTSTEVLVASDAAVPANSSKASASSPVRKTTKQGKSSKRSKGKKQPDTDAA